MKRSAILVCALLSAVSPLAIAQPTGEQLVLENRHVRRLLNRST